MAITAKVSLKINVKATGTAGLGTPTLPITLDPSFSLAAGTGANTVDSLYDSQRTLTDAQAETLDIQDGSLSNSLGQAVTMDVLRLLYIKNTSTTNSLIIGGAAAAQLGLFADGSDKCVLKPGGILLVTAPDANGIDTTTNSDLKLEHDSTDATDLIYDILLMGED